MKDSSAGHIKGAESVSGLGAIVLGAGLALVMPTWLRDFGMALLVAGAAVHGVGMTLKYRLASREGPRLRWEQGLFRLCRACLAGLGMWIAIGLAMRQ